METRFPVLAEIGQPQPSKLLTLTAKSLNVIHRGMERQGRKKEKEGRLLWTSVLAVSQW